jgi:hypothetical protein
VKVNKLKEQQAASELKNTETISKLLSNFFHIPDSIDCLPKYGYIEEIQQLDDSMIINGWTADIDNKIEVVGLAVVDLNTYTPLGFHVPTLIRKDVEQTEGLHSCLNYGFSIKTFTTLPSSEIAVLAILKQGHIISLHKNN